MENLTNFREICINKILSQATTSNFLRFFIFSIPMVKVKHVLIAVLVMTMKVINGFQHKSFTFWKACLSCERVG